MSNPLNASTGLLATLRREVVEYLQADPAFIDPVSIPIIDGGQTDLAKAVSDALTIRAGGLCLVVTTPRVRPSSEVRSLEVTISVQIYEHPLQNWSAKGPQRSPEDVGENLMARLMFTQFGSEFSEGWSPSAVWTNLQFGGLRPVFSSPDQVVFETTFTTRTTLTLR
ncbi:MAG: hypothetical protein J0M24_13790 [Verrucomicrobia bacterium]|nr:hypothetical protein [Verrucomicrobiota bacterium]